MREAIKRMKIEELKRARFHEDQTDRVTECVCERMQR